MDSPKADLRVFCNACRLLRAEIGDPLPQAACPKCGNTDLAAFPPGDEFKLQIGGFEIVSRPVGGGPWLCKSVTKHERFKKTDREHYVERTIDRASNSYYERIVDTETGAVVRYVKEPLTDHIGRGSARTSKPNKT